MQVFSGNQVFRQCAMQLSARKVIMAYFRFENKNIYFEEFYGLSIDFLKG